MKVDLGVHELKYSIFEFLNAFQITQTQNLHDCWLMQAIEPLHRSLYFGLLNRQHVKYLLLPPTHIYICMKFIWCSLYRFIEVYEILFYLIYEK